MRQQVPGSELLQCSCTLLFCSSFYFCLHCWNSGWDLLVTTKTLAVIKCLSGYPPRFVRAGQIHLQQHHQVLSPELFSISHWSRRLGCKHLEVVAASDACENSCSLAWFIWSGIPSECTRHACRINCQVCTCVSWRFSISSQASTDFIKVLHLLLSMTLQASKDPSKTSK